MKSKSSSKIEQQYCEVEVDLQFYSTVHVVLCTLYMYLLQGGCI